MRFLSAALVCLCCAVAVTVATAQEAVSFAAMAQRPPTYTAAAPVAPLDFAVMAQRQPVMQAAPVPGLDFAAMRERPAPVAPAVTQAQPCVGPNCQTTNALANYQTGGRWVQTLFGKWKWKPN